MPRRPGRPPTPQHIVDEARVLRARGLSLELIALRLEIGRHAVHNAVRDMPVDNRTRARPPSRPPRWLARARQLADSGLSTHAIAARLGVAKSVVYRARARWPEFRA